MSRPYRLGDLPRPLWVRFNKDPDGILRDFPDEKTEFLLLGYFPLRDEIILATPVGRNPMSETPLLCRWRLRDLLRCDAEWRPLRTELAGGAIDGCNPWGRIGYEIQRGQLQPDCVTWKAVP